MLNALKHYRTTYLKLSPLPSLNEKTPLIGHSKNPDKSIISEGPIRLLVQDCFDQAADKLESSEAVIQVGSASNLIRGKDKEDLLSA
jgi:hypothetical protein